jgi:hypothetical protein
VQFSAATNDNLPLSGLQFWSASTCQEVLVGHPNRLDRDSDYQSVRMSDGCSRLQSGHRSSPSCSRNIGDVINDLD